MIGVIGFELEDEAQPAADKIHWIDDRGREHPDGQHHLEQILDVSQKQLAIASNRLIPTVKDHLESTAARYEYQRQGDRRMVSKASCRSGSSTNSEINQADQNLREGKNLAREVDFCHQVGVRAERHSGKPQRRCEAVPEQEPGVRKHWIWNRRLECGDAGEDDENSTVLTSGMKIAHANPITDCL